MVARSILKVAGVALALSGCITGGKPSYEKAEVLDTLGGKEPPEWTHGDIAMIEEGGEIVFINQMTMSGNSRAEACLKAADTDGRSAMLRYIKDNLTSSGQLNESDAVSDPSYEQLTAFLSQGSLSGVKVKERFWLKQEESAESGERVLKLKCMAKLAIKKSDLEKQLRAALGNGGNQQVRDKLIKAQEQFIENLGKESQPQGEEAH